MSNDKLTVYWAPVYGDPSTSTNLNMMFPDPVSVWKDMISLKNPEVGTMGMWNCPAVRDRMQTSFVFKNGLKTSFSWDSKSDPIVKPIEGAPAGYYKASNVLGGVAVNIDIYKWIFFCEEEVTALIHQPIYHPPTELSQKGTYPAGRFDISKWFRPVSSEIQMWSEKGSVTIQEGDPIMYVEFLTDRPVEMKRFVVDQELCDILVACSTSSQVYGSNLPLVKRYKRFKETKTNILVAKAIKRNLLD